MRICRCPNCNTPVDISEWNEIDPTICMYCCEAFEYEEMDQDTVKEVDERTGDLKLL